MSDYWLGFVIGVFIIVIPSILLYLIILRPTDNLLKGYSERHIARWKMEKAFDAEGVGGN